MVQSIEDDSEMPEPLNTAKKQEKKAKQLASAFRDQKARSVSPPQTQGFFSRTRIVTMVGGEKIVIQFRVEPLVVNCFNRARSFLGDVVPTVHYIQDEELEALGITTYAMLYMPGDLWMRVPDSKIESRVSIASSLGAILARGFVQNESSAVVDNYILPSLRRIRESLDSSTQPLVSHVDQLLAAAPALKGLPLWISHHDLNEVNVLVKDQLAVSGIVDWEFSRDLPFGVGLHRVCDTVVGRNFRGTLELAPGYELAEAKFWSGLWDNMEKEARQIIGNNLEAFAAAINIGSLLFAFLDEDATEAEAKLRIPSARQLSFLEAILTYQPPQTRGDLGPFEPSFLN